MCNVNKDCSLKAKDSTEDSRLKAKAGAKDWDFVLKDNQGPRPRTTSLELGQLAVVSGHPQ